MTQTKIKQHFLVNKDLDEIIDNNDFKYITKIYYDTKEWKLAQLGIFIIESKNDKNEFVFNLDITTASTSINSIEYKHYERNQKQEILLLLHEILIKTNQFLLFYEFINDINLHEFKVVRWEKDISNFKIRYDTIEFPEGDCYTLGCYCFSTTMEEFIHKRNDKVHSKFSEYVKRYYPITFQLLVEKKIITSSISNDYYLDRSTNIHINSITKTNKWTKEQALKAFLKQEGITEEFYTTRVERLQEETNVL